MKYFSASFLLFFCGTNFSNVTIMTFINFDFSLLRNCLQNLNKQKIWIGGEKESKDNGQND